MAKVLMLSPHCDDIPLSLGASPRATIALDRCARAHAWLAGRDYVTPDDIKRAAQPACLMASGSRKPPTISA